jgi:ectoine hydroxylase-related dioxygenase (phytanoyl-CoA dioxygenase family)
MHFHSAPAGFMCGLWIALEDVRPEAGPLIYYPGSHRSPYPDADPANLGLSTGGFVNRMAISWPRPAGRRSRRCSSAARR